MSCNSFLTLVLLKVFLFICRATADSMLHNTALTTTASCLALTRWAICHCFIAQDIQVWPCCTSTKLQLHFYEIVLVKVDCECMHCCWNNGRNKWIEPASGCKDLVNLLRITCVSSNWRHRFLNSHQHQMTCLLCASPVERQVIFSVCVTILSNQINYFNQLYLYLYT